MPVLAEEAVSGSFDPTQIMGWVKSVAEIMNVYPINIFIGIGVVGAVIGLIVLAVHAFKKR